jgi:hypothetical protein
MFPSTRDHAYVVCSASGFILTVVCVLQVIMNKIKRCKTDSFPGLEFDNPERPECNNLLSIYQIITGKTKEVANLYMHALQT